MKRTPMKRRPPKTHTQDQAWAKTIKNRDQHTCRRCGKPGTDAHHIIPRNLKATRWNPDNGVTLCRNCHTRIEDHQCEDWADWKQPANLAGLTWLDAGGQRLIDS